MQSTLTAKLFWQQYFNKGVSISSRELYSWFSLEFRLGYSFFAKCQAFLGIFSLIY